MIEADADDEDVAALIVYLQLRGIQVDVGETWVSYTNAPVGLPLFDILTGSVLVNLRQFVKTLDATYPVATD